jgi:hypothetical protein
MNIANMHVVTICIIIFGEIKHNELESVKFVLIEASQVMHELKLLSEQVKQAPTHIILKFYNLYNANLCLLKSYNLDLIYYNFLIFNLQIFIIYIS